MFVCVCVCVCVCVQTNVSCVCADERVCVCVCARARACVFILFFKPTRTVILGPGAVVIKEPQTYRPCEVGLRQAAEALLREQLGTRDCEPLICR